MTKLYILSSYDASKIASFNSPASGNCMLVFKQHKHLVGGFTIYQESKPVAQQREGVLSLLPAGSSPPCPSPTHTDSPALCFPDTRFFLLSFSLLTSAPCSQISSFLILSPSYINTGGGIRWVCSALAPPSHQLSGFNKLPNSHILGCYLVKELFQSCV